MGKETAFWEAVIAVAPLLALTIVVEFRTLRWERIDALFKVVFLTFMTISLVLLTSALTVSILKLLTWGSDEPLWIESPEDPVIAAAGIIFAAAGILIVPVSTTFFVALGPAMSAKVRKLTRLHRATDRAFGRKIESLLHQRHETRLGLAEAVFAGNGDLLADASIAAIRRDSRHLNRRLRSTELAYMKWEKASLRRLKKARRSYTVRKASDIIYRRPTLRR